MTDATPQSSSNLSEKYRFDSTVEQYKGDLNIHLETWKFRLQAKNIEIRAAIDFALSALRSLILVNGGAIIGIMTFLGNLSVRTGDGARSVALRMSMPLAFLIAGLVLAVFATMLSYVVQISFAEFSSPGDGSMPKIGRFGRWIACVAATGSLFFFSAGAWSSLSAFQDSLK